MRVLVDLDGIIYRCLCATSDQGYFAQLRACYTTVERVLDRFDNPPYFMALTGSNNFRYKISNSYKANRKLVEKPKYLHDARVWFVKYYDAVVSEGYEADDLIAMEATEEDIICANDKDYKQLANRKLYNPWKDEMVFIDDYTAAYNFYLQLLTGDATDNIKGLPNPAKAHHKNPPNFTEKTASEVLTGTREEMRDTVIGLYKEVYRDRWFTELDTVASLLWLVRGPNSSYTEYL